MDSPRGGSEWRASGSHGTVVLVPINSTAPHTADALQRALAASQAEVALLKLTVDKLTLQLLKARRAQFGSSSE